MQRWCWRLRSLAAVHSTPKLHHHRHTFFPIRPLHSSPNLLHKPPIFTNSVISSYFTSQLNASPIPSHLSYSPLSVSLPLLTLSISCYSVLSTILVIESMQDAGLLLWDYIYIIPFLNLDMFNFAHLRWDLLFLFRN